MIEYFHLAHPIIEIGNKSSISFRETYRRYFPFIFVFIGIFSVVTIFSFFSIGKIIPILILVILLLGSIFYFGIIDMYGLYFILYFCLGPPRAIFGGILVLFRRAQAAFERLWIRIFFN